MLAKLQAALRTIPIWLVYGLGLVPAAWDFYRGAMGTLGPDPVRTFEHLLGLWALRFLIATLLVTPIRDLWGLNLLRFRRALGLLAFYYALMHMGVYLILDQGGNLGMLVQDVLRRPFITVGMISLALLVPLAVTSNNFSIRKLGDKWGKLHRLIYVVALGGALHFALSVKVITAEPFIYIAILVLLVAYRPVRKPLLKWRRRRQAEAMGR